MYARNDMPISFPGLFGDWEVNPSPVAIPIGMANKALDSSPPLFLLLRGRRKIKE